jgi:hypothetical protein
VSVPTTVEYFFFALLIVVILILIYFQISFIFGTVDLFLALLMQVAFSLGVRAISVKFGVTGVLAGCILRVLLLLITGSEMVPTLKTAVLPYGTEGASSPGAYMDLGSPIPDVRSPGYFGTLDEILQNGGDRARPTEWNTPRAEMHIIPGEAGPSHRETEGLAFASEAERCQRVLELQK